jgi:outer membrane lipoprotein-sorting protein
LKQRFWIKIAICIVLVLTVVPVIVAQTPQPFSADMTMTTAKNGEPVSGKVFYSLPKMRWDMSTHGQNVSMIVNSGKPDASFDPKNPCGKMADVTCKNSGTETVNGRLCDKWVTTDKNGKTTTAWIDKKLFFPIKTVTADGATMELTNIKEGAPPASTFDVPAGYQKMDMGGMMRGQKPPQ